uniref:Uncharacterized protein n=1 Tax=Rhizophora mucronata TaxID=61149 RepID=A0A2P2NIW0_RHIMU
MMKPPTFNHCHTPYIITQLTKNIDPEFIQTLCNHSATSLSLRSFQ